MGVTRILLIGAGGQIGRHLKYQLKSFGRVIAPTRLACDLTNIDSVVRCCELVKPKLIVNAAGYTDVAGAERNKDLCHAVNVSGTALLVEMAKKHDAPLIHYSSDYVFDGANITPYRENEFMNPLNVYGVSKRDSDLIISTSGIPHLIFRVSWVYDSQGTNFLTKMIKLMRDRKEVSVVGDQFGVPNSAYSIADYTRQVLESRYRLNAVFSRSGTYHLVGDDYTSWYNFALEIVKRIPAEKRRCDTLSYLSSQQFKGVRRPMYSVLSNELAKKIFKVKFLNWKEAFIRDILLG